MLLLSEAGKPDAQFEIVAVTAVSGNVDVAAVTENICRVFEVFKECNDAFVAPPVYIGCERPLVAEPMRSTEYHGACTTICDVCRGLTAVFVITWIML